MKETETWGAPDLLRQSPKYEGNPLTAPIRFEPLVEAEFVASREVLGRRWRMMLGAAVLVYLIIMLLCSYTLLIAPPAVAAVNRPLLAFLMIPCTALALLCSVWRPLHRWSVDAWILAALVNMAGMILLRVVFARGGYDIVPLVQLLALLLALIIVHMPTAKMVVSGLVGLGAGLAVEFWEFGVDAGSLLEAGTIVVVAGIGMLMMVEFDKLLRVNWYRECYLDELAGTDALTGLGNRRHFDGMLRQLIRAAARERGNLALLLLDVDHFKSYNDHYGHPAGDQCLEAIGGYLRSARRRPHDFAARLGGEEFAVVWFDARAGDAAALAEELRRGIAALGIPPAPGRGASVTVSGGFVQVLAPQPEEATEQIAIDLMRRADAALYEAKHRGRDRLVVDEVSG